MVELVYTMDLGSVSTVKVLRMDFWMLARRDLPGDLLDIFTTLGDLQYQYDWVISDHDLYFAPNTPEEVCRRWSWTGLLTDGRELTKHLSSGDVFFWSGGVLSAVPKGTQPEQVWDYEPGWDISELGSPDYRFQTPLTQMEIICYDGYAWLIICQPGMMPRIQKVFPQVKVPGDFYKGQRK